MNRNIPLSIDDELLTEIDKVVESTKESRSAVMRRAIREGLPLVKSGGAADVVTLDSETSRDLDAASKETNVSRSKILIEAVRTGLQAAYSALMRDKLVRAQEQNPKDKDAETMIYGWEHSILMHDPMGREVRAAMRQRGAALNRLWDILQHVPEAWRRYELVEKLTQMRRSPGGGGGSVWGHGLSTNEVDWQIKMNEKYGISGKISDEEVKARDAARAADDYTHRNMVSKHLFKTPYPEE